MKKFCLYLLKIIIAVFVINFMVVEIFTTSHYLTNNTIIIIYSIVAFLACCMLLGWIIFSYSRVLYIITGICLTVFFSMYHFIPSISVAHFEQYKIEYHEE